MALDLVSNEPMKTDHDAPRVRYATFVNEDTGEITPLHLYTHEAIDDEIDQRVKFDKRAGLEHHEITRAKWHALLDTVSATRRAA
jgi:hypothetical protein